MIQQKNREKKEIVKVICKKISCSFIKIIKKCEKKEKNTSYHCKYTLQITIDFYI